MLLPYKARFGGAKFGPTNVWQNGTRCRDGVNVLWCLVWQVFEDSIPTCACFHLESSYNYTHTCTSDYTSTIEHNRTFQEHN